MEVPGFQGRGEVHLLDKLLAMGVEGVHRSAFLGQALSSGALREL